MLRKHLTIFALILGSLWGIEAQKKKVEYVNNEAERLQITSDRLGQPKYVGEDERVARVFEKYNKLFDLYQFVTFDESADTVPMADRYDLLYKNRDEMSKEIASLDSPEMRDFLTTLTNDACLNLQIRLEKDSLKQDKLYDRIDQNSWIGIFNYLPQWKLERTLPRADYDGDIVPFGLAFIDSIRTNVSDPVVRDALLAKCAMYVLDWGKTDDVDSFWKPFKEFAGAENPVTKRYESKVKAIKRTRGGMPAVNVEFTDRDGRKVKLSDLYGKVLYIDIWATWCGPCRKEIPYVEKHVEHYKDNDKVRFVSISFDDNHQAWKRLIEKDKPQWEQYVTTPRQHDAISKAYGISGIPRFIIINADGTLYDANAMRPSDPEFITKLDEIIRFQKK